MLGAVMSYGQVVAPLQSVWRDDAGARAAAPVQSLRQQRHGAEEDRRRRAASRSTPASPSVSTSPSSPKAASSPTRSEERSRRRRAPAGAAPRLRPDRLGRHRHLRRRRCGRQRGVAYERFTRHGPAALLPLKDGRAGLVWCVDSRDDPVQGARRRAARRRPQHDLSSAHAAPRRGVAAEGVPARPVRRAHAHRRPHGAHRQRRADAASGRRPGPQPRHARRLRAGALARERARRRRRPAPARMAARARPLGDDRRDRLPRAQLHLGPARRGDGARRRPVRAAGARRRSSRRSRAR